MKFQSSCAHYGAEPQIEIGPKRGARFVRNFDMGTAKAARAIEPLCQLWCIPGFIANECADKFEVSLGHIYNVIANRVHRNPSLPVLNVWKGTTNAAA